MEIRKKLRLSTRNNFEIKQKKHIKQNTNFSPSISNSYVFLSFVYLVGKRLLIISASKIEIFLSNEDFSSIENVENINWEYLGYITLSTNESTDFKSRELKSANVPKKQVTYIKMNLHGNHFNSHNSFNQVGNFSLNYIQVIHLAK